MARTMRNGGEHLQRNRMITRARSMKKRARSQAMKYDFGEAEMSGVICRRENADRNHTTREDL